MFLKVGVVSLGCAKNLVDSEVMLGILRQDGYQFTNRPEKADILIVNTCGFIESAKQESVNTILELAQHKTNGICKLLVVTGCLAQRYPQELMEEIPEIDVVLGTGEWKQISKAVERALQGNKINQTGIPESIYDHTLPRILSTPFYTAYLKIAEGCDNCCSYCIIPTLRGRFRSRLMSSILEEAKILAKQGIKELILIAQDTTRYGEDLYGEYKLADLLQQLVEIEGIEWIRLLYCYPAHFTQQLIEVIAQEPKICKYLDIPLQHADNEILRKMHRKDTRESILALIKRLREAIPDLVLRTSFIVGFPGENEKHFQTLLAFMREVRFDRVGIFTYSQEEGTQAALLPDQLSEEVKQQRYHRAMAVQKEISLELNQQKIGKTLEVLVERTVHTQPSTIVGRSRGDAPEIDGMVYVTNASVNPGEIIKARIVQASEYDLMGEKV